MKELTLKQIKPSLTWATKSSRPLLTMANVTENAIEVTDLETHLVLKGNYGLEPGLHTIKTLGLVGPSNADPNEYPVMDINLENSDFSFIWNLKSLQTLAPCMSKDETRINLNGVAVIGAELFACDGHRLAWDDIQAPEKAEENYILPRQSLTVLISLLRKFKIEGFSVDISGNWAIVENEAFRLSMRLIQREYPRIHSVIPTKTAHEFIINNWVNFKEVKNLLNKRSMGCKLILKDSKVFFENVNNETETVRYEIGRCAPELNWILAFNAKYLDDVIGKNKEVTVKFNKALNPVIITAPGLKSVVMPLKLDDVGEQAPEKCEASA